MRLNLTERLPACIRAVRTHPQRQLFRHSTSFRLKRTPCSCINNEGMHSSEAAGDGGTGARCAPGKKASSVVRLALGAAVPPP